MSRAERLVLLGALALGVFVRLYPSFGADGPIGDGGLFYAMVEDVRRAGLGIPATTSYNELGIPFVYPPLAILATAALGQAAGVPTLDLLTWVPPLLAIASLGAFALLAMRCLPPMAAALATATYALMPHAYDWVVGGGGLTRGLGLTLALLAAAVACGRLRRRRDVVLAGVLIGVAGLSHPQAAIFGLMAVTVLSFERDRAWVPRIAAVAGISLIVFAPWLAVVAATHGIGALLAAGNRLEPAIGLVRLLNLEFAGAPFMNVFVVPATVGIFLAVVRGSWRILVLLLLTYLLGAGGGEYLAAVPWSLLAGIGAAGIVDLVARDWRLPRGSRLPVTLGSTALLVLLAIIGSIGSSADRSSKLQALGSDRLEAMRWAADNLSSDAGIVVATVDVWGDDEISEWLPAIAGRHSIGTVQGSEWLGVDGFERQLAAHEAIRDCAGHTAACYRAVAPDAVIFVPKGPIAGPLSQDDCCPALRETLEDDGYEIVYDGPGATIAIP
ncbi:MAG TPA: hypothetical protein VHR55_12915 [Candidatus Limnocylindria bacterium]|nr:hypothetical protein [Candidatus Limnocylindria bacterium]